MWGGIFNCPLRVRRVVEGDDESISLGNNKRWVQLNIHVGNLLGVRPIIPP